MRLHIIVSPILTEQLTKECDGRVTAAAAAVAAAMLALLKQTASPVLIMPQAFVMNSRLRILNFCIYWNTLYAKRRRKPIWHSLEFRCASVLLQMSENDNNASDKKSTGYSFWDRLRNFSHKFTWIVLPVNKFNKLGKLGMDNCWISCQVMADIKKVYDDLKIINLWQTDTSDDAE